MRQTTKPFVYIFCTYIGKELPILCFSDTCSIDQDYKYSSLYLDTKVSGVVGILCNKIDIVLFEY